MMGAGLRIADVGTGSGCIAVALAKELPGAWAFVAVDVSAAALAVARRNAVRHGVAERIQFVEGNVFQELGKSDTLAQHAAPLQRAVTADDLLLDLIVSNPPYVGRREAENAGARSARPRAGGCAVRRRGRLRALRRAYSSGNGSI